MWKTDKNNMKIKQKFHTGTVSKANRTMVKRCKLATLNTQIHFPVFAQALQSKVAGLNQSYATKYNKKLNVV